MTRRQIEETLTALLHERCVEEPVHREQQAQQALDLARSIGWHEGIARSMLQLARFQQPQIAFDTLLQARHLFRRLGDRKGEATTLHNLGLIHCYAEHYVIAAWFYGRAFELLEEEGTALHEQAQVLASLCATQFDRGDVHTGLALAGEAVAICRQEALGNLEAHILTGTARTLWLQGQHHTALIFASKSVRLFPRKAHDRTEQAMAEAAVSGIEVDLGNAMGAIEHGKRALKLLRPEVRGNEEAVVLLGLGLACHLRESFAESRDHYMASLQIATDIEDQAILVCTLAALGSLELSQDTVTDALTHLLQAEEIATMLEDRRLRTLVSFGLYRAWKAADNTNEALLHLERYMRHAGDRSAPGAVLQFNDLPVHEEIDRKRRRGEICRLALPAVWRS